MTHSQPVVDDKKTARSHVVELLKSMQNKITKAIDQINQVTFHEDQWSRDGGGGGQTRIYGDAGRFLEKGGVNFSEVHGQLSSDFAKTLPHGSGTEFYATGISLVLHSKNPFVPTVHANYRYLERGDTAWFGGGADLTPFYLFEEDAVHFHSMHKRALDSFDPTLYPLWKKQCDDYFYLPHRKECRGIGGIFFDYQLVNDDTAEKGFSFSQRLQMIEACVNAFLDGYLPIVEKRKGMNFTETQKNWQLTRLGRYVEFNLVYDRGTLFGLKTNGRIESILMSLPPTAKWIYDHHPEAGSEEAKLIEVLQHPKQWVTSPSNLS